MVEVFKTNIKKKYQCQVVTKAVLKYNPHYKINFDLEDCDRVLRIEAFNIDNNDIISLLGEYGFECEVLPD